MPCLELPVQLTTLCDIFNELLAYTMVLSFIPWARGIYSTYIHTTNTTGTEPAIEFES